MSKATLPLPLPKTSVDARPLVLALERIADAGRKRRQAGQDDAAVEYARLAYDALLWLEADEKENVETATLLLERIYTRPL